MYSEDFMNFLSQCIKDAEEKQQIFSNRIEEFKNGHDNIENEEPKPYYDEDEVEEKVTKIQCMINFYEEVAKKAQEILDEQNR